MELSKLLIMSEEQIQELTIMEQMTWWIWKTEEINMKIRQLINEQIQSSSDQKENQT